MSAYIYALIDPTTQELRYVGKATCVAGRLSVHVSEAKREARTHCHRWIKSLLNAGVRPDVEVIEVVERERVTEAERFWIAYFKGIGCALTNGTAGGEGMFGRVMSAETKAKISASKKGKPNLALRGRKPSAATIAAVKRARQKFPPWNKGMRMGRRDQVVT